MLRDRTNQLIEKQPTSAEPVIVGLGEVLWDMFPEGAKFGGAPANFACSVAGISSKAANVFVVSAVGHDELGNQAAESLLAHGVRTEFLDRTRQPTGQVFIRLDSEGNASYQFAPNCAWDNLGWTKELSELASRSDAVCFGSLGQRSSLSRSTIAQFVNGTPQECVRIFDINLRPPFFCDAVIDESLNLANVLKLNDEELPHLARQYGLRGSDEDILQAIAERFALRCVALTRGANGAMLIRDQEVIDVDGQAVPVADTVGAGDAFSAALAYGLLADLDLQVIADRATAIASFICQHAGATPAIPPELQFYR